MSAERPIRALLVDPSLFTGPYDAALTQGLLDVGVRPLWATRPTRAGDKQEIPADYVDDFFYRRVDEATALPGKLRVIAKGLAHLWGVLLLLWRVWQLKPDVVHYQWTVLPFVDALAMWIIRRTRPVVLTVHDTIPFNGERMSFLQNMGFDLPLRLADHLIVHTQAGRQALIKRGLAAEKITVIPHGPLSLSVPMQATVSTSTHWTFVIFGEIKPYKGVDVLIEAVAKIPEPLRSSARVVVAGRPRMDMDVLIKRIKELGLESVIELRLQRLSDEEMTHLFSEADCFVFPYRQIDASGVYFLTKSLGRWLIASRVGVFLEDIKEGIEGALVPCEDADALSKEMCRAIELKPRPNAQSPANSWRQIGRQTRTLYAELSASSR